MIRIVKNIKRKNFEFLKDERGDNRRGRYFTRDRIEKIEERLSALEEKSGSGRG